MLQSLDQQRLAAGPLTEYSQYGEEDFGDTTPRAGMIPAEGNQKDT